MPTYVLDSYALLALLSGEAGGHRVREILEQAQQEECQAYISLINLGELAYIIERRAGYERSQTVLAYLRRTAVEWMPVTEAQVWSASHIKATHPISYADAFAAALTLAFGGVLVTGDPEFRVLADRIQIEWLPPNNPQAR